MYTVWGKFSQGDSDGAFGDLGIPSELEQVNGNWVVRVPEFGIATQVQAASNSTREGALSDAEQFIQEGKRLTDVLAPSTLGNVYGFLDRLRNSGAINMFGAGEYVGPAFGLDRHDARNAVSRWMTTFSSRHPNG